MDPITGEALKAVTGAADSLKAGGQAVASGDMGKRTYTQSKAEGTEGEAKEGGAAGGVEDVEKSVTNVPDAFFGYPNQQAEKSATNNILLHLFFGISSQKTHRRGRIISGLSPRKEGSLISSNVTGDSYVWTPSDSLVLGGFYLIKLSEQGGQIASSDYLVCTASSTTVTMIINLFVGPPPASQSSTSKSSASQSSASQSSVSRSSASISPKLQNSPTRQPTLNQSTIVGVAVGVAVFILLILTFAILCWRHRRRSLEKAAIELPGHQTDAEVKSDPHTTIWVPELGQEGAVHGPHELPGTPISTDETATADESSTAEGRVFEMAESE